MPETVCHSISKMPQWKISFKEIFDNLHNMGSTLNSKALMLTSCYLQMMMTTVDIETVHVFDSHDLD